jgi:Na+/proline symporter
MHFCIPDLCFNFLLKPFYLFFFAFAFFFAGIAFSSQFVSESSASNLGGARIQHHV